MAEVNEQIVKEWLQICKEQFTMENVIFKVTGPKGGSNYSDIDILSVDKEGNYYDREIKWRSAFSMSSPDTEKGKEAIKHILNQLCRKERRAKIKKLIGNQKYKKIFVTNKTSFGGTLEKQKRIEEAFKKEGIDVEYFEDILKELVDKIEEKGKYDSQVPQIIRMIKMNYDTLPKKEGDKNSIKLQ